MNAPLNPLPTDAYAVADLALYSAKHAGRGRLALHEARDPEVAATTP